MLNTHLSFIQILMLSALCTSTLLSISAQGAATDSHENETHAEVTLSPEQQQAANIRTAPLRYRNNAFREIYAPGEVINNQYNTTMISSQTGATIIARHVILGQHVSANDKLLTLYSQDMAKLQSQLILSWQEWQRIKTLGIKTVGGKKYSETQIAFQQAKASVRAAGMNDAGIQQIMSERYSLALGEYVIVAQHQGIVLSDDFHQGQFLNAGDPIITLVDESTLWIDAQFAPELGLEIPQNTSARVQISDGWFEAKVIQESHAIDEQTRTRNIRLKMDNPKHLLHTGLFAEVYLQLLVPGKTLLVPEAALMLSGDGDWIIFIEESPNVFSSIEVERLGTIDKLIAISGLDEEIAPGKTFATSGAFFLASELAKSGFDPHNH